MRIFLENSSEPHSVLVTCRNQQEALDDQTIMGSRWEAPGDMDMAYAYIDDQPDLVQKLEEDGYEVDSSEYTPQETQS